MFTRRFALGFGILLMTGMVIFPRRTPATAAEQAITITPVADAYVDATLPDTNYGTRTTLRVDGSPIVRSYLRFNLTGINGIISQAKLRIYANSASTSGISIWRLTNTTWSESGITYANAPVPGSLFGTTGSVSAGSWQEIDVTSLMPASGLVSLVIGTPGGTAISLSSRESGANAPQLVLTIGSINSTSTVPPSNTPVPTNLPTATRTRTTTPTKPATLTPTGTGSPSSTPTADIEPRFPIRAAFYYPWYPEAWTQQGVYPYTNYTPSLGYYASGDSTIIKKHIAAMQYGKIQVGISSWWGPGHYTDNRVSTLLTAASGTPFRWTLYYENESMGDPTISQIQSDLTYIRDHYGNNPSYLRVDGKFVVFVYADANDGCGMVDRWKQGNTVGAYIILKVFEGYTTCVSQPDGWHQYSPAVAADQQGSLSYAISPGFWQKGSAERLARDISRWAQNVRDMVASGANWQLITTFNEWGEGTVVEMAQEWASASTYGNYLDALHADGQLSIATPTPTATNSSPTLTPTIMISPTITAIAPTATPGTTATPPSGSITVKFTPVADAYVDSSVPGTNYGKLTTLRVDGSPVVRSYLRFNITGVSGVIAQAKMRFYANSSSSSGISGWVVNNTTWGETSITYANAPAPGSVIATSSAVSAGSWKELDVTRLVIGNGLISMGLSTAGSTAISLASRESGANAPQLVITFQSTGNGTPTPTQTPTSTLEPGSVVVLAAGDIAKCSGGTPSPTSGAKITSDMLLNVSGNLFTLGDNSNDSGSATDYTNCFDPTWGRLKSRINPVIGNHELSSDGQGTPYFNYFGAPAYPAQFGHYSMDLGSWHIVVLNAECGIGYQGCGAGSIQETWLRSDLAAHTQQCTLALWHQPLFTSGTQSAYTGMRAFWQALYDYHAELIVNGHNHNYERFDLQDPNAVYDPLNGIREIVVGTGGASLDVSSFPMAANQLVRDASAYGYLKLTLKPGSYDWEFVPQPGKTFTDRGSGVCH